MQKMLETPEGEMNNVLGPILVWSWPRSDMGAWIAVLDKFDAILAGIVTKYELETLQMTQFSELDKSTLLSILRFLRLLFENTTNRKVFSSYDV
jgi:E3 ubiquitin-protein ligase HUWE1